MPIRSSHTGIVLAVGDERLVDYGGGFTYSVAGARPNGQAELLDTAMGIDAVGEFQILTNTYSVQFGGNGSVLNEVTKSSTNSFHGSAYGFLRNSAFFFTNYDACSRHWERRRLSSFPTPM